MSAMVSLHDFLMVVMVRPECSEGVMEEQIVDIVGAGLAGSEAAYQLAVRGIRVRLYDMRPFKKTAVHKTDQCSELVCSNSLKSTRPDSAAGMLKYELSCLKSCVLQCAYDTQVPAGGALAVDRDLFARAVTALIDNHPLIERITAEVVGIEPSGALRVVDDSCDEGEVIAPPAQAVIIASGPLTSDALAQTVQDLTGHEHLAFYDAAAPVVMADSLDRSRVFSQSRYEDTGIGDYLNAPFDRESYERFIHALLEADRVIKRDFETADLFQACQPIEEIARRGFDAPRFGPLKPVGLIDPATGRRPWAVVQLRAEDAHGQSYNLVGFQTNLIFPEQCRVFRMIPGLEQAEFARYGVMHRNTFINAPHLLDSTLCLHSQAASHLPIPLYIAGQLGGTEGYCEAIASGLVAALNVAAKVRKRDIDSFPIDTAFGSLLHYATDATVDDYQPMHVNFGIMRPLETPIRNKRQRYAAYAERGARAMEAYVAHLCQQGLMG